MAAKRRTTVTRPSPGLVLVQQPAAPIARRSGGRRRRRSSGRSRKKGHAASGGSIQKHLQATAIGGLAFGLLVKNFPSLPRIPGIGRSGTVALAVYFLKPRNEILKSMGIAAAAIAGYSFGETGTVAGDDDVLSSQI